MIETPKAIEVFAADQCVEVGNDEYVVTVGAHPDLVRNPRTAEDGTVIEQEPPSQPGDVLSVQEDGSLQTRPAGTEGPFERACIEDGRLVYRPKGPFGRTFVAGHVTSWPNP